MAETLLTAVFGVFVAALTRGFTGFGFGLVAVPLLSLALPPTRVVPFVVALQVIVGALGIRHAWRHCDWRVVGGLSPGLLLGVPLGLAMLTGFRPNPVRLTIGCMILVFVLLLWRGARLPPKPSRILTIAVGFASGIMSGLSSMGGPPIVVYLLALSHESAVVRASSIVYFMFAASLSLLLMSLKGMIDREILLWSIASVPVLFAGTHLGAWAFRRSHPRHHRLIALSLLSVLAVMLVARALARL